MDRVVGGGIVVGSALVYFASYASQSVGFKCGANLATGRDTRRHVGEHGLRHDGHHHECDHRVFLPYFFYGCVIVSVERMDRYWSERSIFLFV